MSNTDNRTSITIDGKEYEIASLSDTAKAELVNLQIVDRKIAESQQEMAILRTARNAYASALRAALKEVDGGGDE